MSQTIGETLKKARETRKLRQEDMALKLGISARQYQKYEDGKFPKFKGEVVKKIDAILGTNAYELIYEQDVQQGEVKKPASQSDEGLRNDLIEALKMNNALLAQRVSELEGQQGQLQHLEQRLDGLLNNQLGALALTQSYQEYVVRVFWELQGQEDVDVEDILRQIRRRAVEILVSYEEQGIQIVA